MRIGDEMKHSGLFFMSNILIIPSMVYFSDQKWFPFLFLFILWILYLMLYRWRHRDDLHLSKKVKGLSVLFLFLGYFSIFQQCHIGFTILMLLLFNSCILFSLRPGYIENPHSY